MSAFLFSEFSIVVFGTSCLSWTPGLRLSDGGIRGIAILNSKFLEFSTMIIGLI